MTTTATAQHSSESNEWYTPEWLVESIRELLGDIDLDPASSFEAQKVVKAKRWWGEKDPAVRERQWHGRVLLNPPGGVVRSPRPTSNAALWWAHLWREHMAQRVSEAVFIGFNIECMRTCRGLVAYPFVVPHKRLRFDKIDANGVRYTPKHPAHSNVIVYLGENLGRFWRVFGSLGEMPPHSFPDTRPLIHGVEP